MKVKILDTKLTLEVERALEELFIKNGVSFALIIDEAGMVLASQGRLPKHDIESLAALAAANFGATHQIASLLGEKDFSVLYHKGEKENIFLTKLNKDIILITLFPDKTPLGMVRLKVEQFKKFLEEIQWP